VRPPPPPTPLPPVRPQGGFPAVLDNLWLGEDEAAAVATALQPKLAKTEKAVEDALFDVVTLEVALANGGSECGRKRRSPGAALAAGVGRWVWIRWRPGPPLLLGTGAGCGSAGAWGTAWACWRAAPPPAIWSMGEAHGLGPHVSRGR
jgi:hypothetical protein